MNFSESSNNQHQNRKKKHGYVIQQLKTLIKFNLLGINQQAQK